MEIMWRSLLKIMKRASLSVAVIFMVYSFPLMGVCSEYIITLKNGNEIRTPSYSERNGKIYFEQFGAQIGVSKIRIQKIVKSKAGKKNQQDGYRYRRHNGGLSIPVPGYYKISGEKKNKVNGIYEERGTFNDHPTYRQIGGRFSLFFYKKRSVWAIGEYGAHFKHILFIHPVWNELPEVGDRGNGWTSSQVEKTYPDIRVEQVNPPQSIYRGNNAYVAQGFPVKEFNGIYRPEKIYNGWICYKHEKHPYELRYLAGAWSISRCPGNCFTQYSSKKSALTTMPENIKAWYNAENKYITGGISIFNHSKTTKTIE